MDGPGPGFRAGGTIVPNDAGTGYEPSTSGGGGPRGSSRDGGAGGWRGMSGAVHGVGTGTAPSTHRAPSMLPRQARGRTKAAPKIGADNVGFRMLKKAGWTEGTGLGKDGEGAVEPIRAWAKADRKGVGNEAGAGHVVGDPDAKGGKPKPKPKDPIDGDDGPVMSKEQMAAHVAKEKRDKGIAAYVTRLFKEEEPTADMNPLLRHRHKRTRDGTKDPGGDDGGMSANNPLRGLF